jgi:hypothetical protein
MQESNARSHNKVSPSERWGKLAKLLDPEWLGEAIVVLREANLFRGLAPSNLIFRVVR